MFTGANQVIQIKLAAAHTTTALPWTAEATDTSLNTVPYNGTTNGTSAVAVIPASKGFLRGFLLKNADTVVHSLTVTYNDNSTLRDIITISLSVGDVVEYESTYGWRVLDASGKIKTMTSGDWFINTDGSVSLSGRAARSVVNTITWASTITPDFAVANNFDCTLGGGTTLAAPSNLVKGQAGMFRFIQDSSGNRTMSFNTVYDFVGGVAPTLSTAPNSVDLISYYVASATSVIMGNPLLAVS